MSRADSIARIPKAVRFLFQGEKHVIKLNGADLRFILEQILIAEQHAAGTPLRSLLPNSQVPFGLRTLDGSFNNLAFGQSQFGAADNLFPRLLDPYFRPAQPVSVDLDGPGPMTIGTPTSYQQTSGYVFDSEPREISNALVDQTANNPAAVEAAAGEDGVLGTEDDTGELVTSPGLDGEFGTQPGADGILNDDPNTEVDESADNVNDDKEVFFIPNSAPDVGLSAPFNSWMTFFGQFFDHGLDLVTKGGSGTIFIPLQPDDPLYVEGGHTNFMVLTRATNQPGADGILGTADDVHEHTNTTSPFVDQNQTYSSHPSHQVFLREYALDGAGKPVATGSLITGGPDGGMANWGQLKAQARDLLGIELTDANVGNVPLLATDDYAMFLRGPNGFPQVVMQNADGTTYLREGN